MANEPSVRFEGQHCALSLHRPARGVVRLVLTGTDIGELGEAPFHELERDLTAHDCIELFIDASEGRAASIDVSGRWATWLRKHRTRFVHVHMLTGTRFIQLSADFVRRFAELGETMRLYTDSAAFEEAFQQATHPGRS